MEVEGTEQGAQHNLKAVVRVTKHGSFSASWLCWDVGKL